MTEVLLVDIDDGVAVVTLHRPEVRNALNAALRTAAVRAMAQLDGRDDVRAIVLTGTDPAFTAGLDLKELSGPDAPDAAAGVRELLLGDRGPFGLMRTPVIGAINGPAVTGGLEIALACDFLVASERARFADTHARVGIMPGWGLSIRLVEAVGLRRARQMSTTGNYVDASTALAWGLVNEVVPHEGLLPRALELARDIASNDPRAVAHIRETMRLTSEHPGDDAWEIEAARSREWFADFDPAALATRRAAIEARGRSQT
jgi:enoyl-CoA hydratase